jgi:galactokinase
MKEIAALHKAEYGVEPEVIAAAPGTVNLLGEHTDYNEGYVLQFAFCKEIFVSASRRKDNIFRFYAADYKERKKTSLSSLKYKREDRWANYAKGVIHNILALGFDFKGLDLVISGNIVKGIGLGSSAALTVAVALAVKALYSLKLSDIQVIQAAHQSERDFMGLDEEITDQLIAAIAKKNTIVFLDSRTLEYTHIPFKQNDLCFIVTDSNIPRSSMEIDFTEQREHCRQCVEILTRRSGGTALRDFSVSDLQQGMGLIPENVRRSSLHVVEENARVLLGKEMLERGDMAAFGKLMNRSHESLRDLYEVTCPELDWLVKRAMEVEGVLGSRMTGVGFGGCTVTLLPKSKVEEYKQKLEDYERIFGFQPLVYETTLAMKAKIVFQK